VNITSHKSQLNYS